MAYFNITFKLINGDTKSYVYERDTYKQVASDILESKGWFRIKDEFVNLSNVTTFRIVEIKNEKEH